MGAGQKLEFQVPESVSKPAEAAAPAAAADGMTKMEVKVPSTWVPGQKLTVKTPSGAKVMVTPPENATVGMTVSFSVPRDALMDSDQLTARADFMMRRLSVENDTFDEDSARPARGGGGGDGRWQCGWCWWESTRGGPVRLPPPWQVRSNDSDAGPLPNLSRRISSAAEGEAGLSALELERRPRRESRTTQL